MSKDLGPYIPLYYGDFISATMSFGADEIGAYLMLICYQWQNGSIENDQNAIERIARCEYSRLQRVLKKFRPDGNGGLFNERCEQIRQERGRMIESKRRAGEAGANARWHNQSEGNSNRIADAIGQPCISSSSSSSSSMSTSSSVGDRGGALPHAPSKGMNHAINPPSFEECIEMASAIGMDQRQVETFFTHYDSQGWKKGNGQPVTNVRSAMQAWKIREGKFEQKEAITTGKVDTRKSRFT